MQIPLTSLSFADWLVYADYCGEYRKPKDEQYARRIGTALQKMHLSGTDPKCALAFKGWQYDSGYLWHFYEKVSFSVRPLTRDDKRIPSSDVYCRVTGHNRIFFPVGEWRWMTPKEAKVELRQQGLHPMRPKLWGPADIDEPERHRRLIAKFWRVLVRRSTGIPNSILR